MRGMRFPPRSTLPQLCCHSAGKSDADNPRSGDPPLTRSAVKGADKAAVKRPEMMLKPWSICKMILKKPGLSATRVESLTASLTATEQHRADARERRGTKKD